MPARRKCLPCPERDKYVGEVRERGCTEITARVKERYVDEFLRFALETTGKAQFDVITEDLVRKFAGHLHTTSWKRDTACAKLTEVFSWLRWLQAHKKLRFDPTAELKPQALLNDLHAANPRSYMAVSRHARRGSLDVFEDGDAF